MITFIREIRSGYVRAHCITKEKAMVERATRYLGQMVFRPQWVSVVCIRDRRIRHDPDSVTMMTPRWLLEELIVDHTGKKKSKRYKWALMKKNAKREEALAWLGMDDRTARL